MRYLLMAYGDEQQWNSLSASEQAALENECIANDEKLRQSGHLLSVEGLHDGNSATTLRFQKGKVSITDGPFAETKEQLAGIFIINARDLNEAIQVASKMPQVRGGPIEVRPIMEFNPQ